MRKNGFTLIELLAVIVILAIIALIATPIILGIINDARKESQERSAELYLSGVDLAVARRNLTEEFNPSECTIASGVVTCAGYDGSLNVDVDGEVPTSGTIKFENNKATTGTTLTFNEFTATLSEEGKIVIGEIEETSVAKACTIQKQDASKYSVGDIITCTLSESTDKFYVIEDTDIDATTIQMLTEKNIHTTEFRQSDNAGIKEFSNSDYWTGTSAEYPAYIYNENSLLYPIVDNYVNYLNGSLTEDATGSLLTYSQVEYLGCIRDNASCAPGVNGGGTAPEWLYSNSDYWIGTSNNSLNVEYIESGGRFSNAYYSDYSYGVRPVITISTSDIQQ